MCLSVCVKVCLSVCELPHAFGALSALERIPFLSTCAPCASYDSFFCTAAAAAAAALLVHSDPPPLPPLQAYCKRLAPEHFSIVLQ